MVRKMNLFLTPEDEEEIETNPEAERFYVLGIMQGATATFLGVIVGELLLRLKLYLLG